MTAYDEQTVLIGVRMLREGTDPSHIVRHFYRRLAQHPTNPLPWTPPASDLSDDGDTLAEETTA